MKPLIQQPHEEAKKNFYDDDLAKKTVVMVVLNFSSLLMKDEPGVL